MNRPWCELRMSDVFSAGHRCCFRSLCLDAFARCPLQLLKQLVTCSIRVLSINQALSSVPIDLLKLDASTHSPLTCCRIRPPSHSPAHPTGHSQLFEQIVTCPLDLKSEPWPHISPAAKDLVRRMLTRDPARRLTATQVWGCLKEGGI